MAKFRGKLMLILLDHLSDLLAQFHISHCFLLKHPNDFGFIISLSYERAWQWFCLCMLFADSSCLLSVKLRVSVMLSLSCKQNVLSLINVGCHIVLFLLIFNRGSLITEITPTTRTYISYPRIHDSRAKGSKKFISVILQTLL